MANTITVVCPYCNNRMRASSEYIGRKGRCPSCKSLVEITSTAGDDSVVKLTPMVSAPRRTDLRLSSMNVPVWLAGLIGAAITAALYVGIFWPLYSRDTYLGNLMMGRGPCQYCTMLVTCWGLSLLVMKYIAVKKQLSYAELELELIPLEIGLQITPGNVDQFLGHLSGLSPAERQSILGRRIQGALEHFKSRNSVPEVQDYLAKQADLDASSVDAGYSLLRSFIWVIPLLGFIGTVTGISEAVTGLDKTLTEKQAPAAAQAASPSSDNPGPASSARAKGSTSEKGPDLMAGLGSVTSGLATAFDTTFLALVMAIVLLFPTESLRKIEYGMLDRIEAFTNESLLRRMAEERKGTAHEELPQVVRDALESAFQEHQKWLAQWQAQVAQLGQLIGADFEAAVGRIQEKIVHAEEQRMGKMDNLQRVMEGMFRQAEAATVTWQQAEHGLAANTQNLQNAVLQLNQAVAENGRVMQEMAKLPVVGQTTNAEIFHSLGELATQIGRLGQRLDAAENMERDGWQGPVSALTPIDGIQPVGDLPANLPRKGVFGRIFGRRR